MMNVWKGKGRAYSSTFIANLPDIGIPTTSRRGAVIAFAHAQIAERHGHGGQARACHRLASSSTARSGLCSQEYEGIRRGSCQARLRRTYATAGAALAEVEDEGGRDTTFEADVWSTESFDMQGRREAAGIGVGREGGTWIPPTGIRRDGRRLYDRTKEKAWGRPTREGGTLDETPSTDQDSFGSGQGQPSISVLDGDADVIQVSKDARFGNGRMSKSGARADNGEANLGGSAAAVSPAIHPPRTTWDSSLATKEEEEARTTSDFVTEILRATELSPTACVALVPVSRHSGQLYRTWRTELFDTLMHSSHKTALPDRANHLAMTLCVFRDISDTGRRAIRKGALSGTIKLILGTPPEELLKLRDELDGFFAYCLVTLSTVSDNGYKTLSPAQNYFLKGRYLGRTIQAALRCRMTQRASDLLRKGYQKGFLRGISKLDPAGDKVTDERRVNDLDIVDVLAEERDPGVLELLTGAVMPDSNIGSPPHARILELRMKALLRTHRPADAIELFDRNHRRSGLDLSLTAISLRLCATLAVGDVEQATYCWARLNDIDIVWTRSDGQRLVHEYWAELSRTIAKSGITSRTWAVANKLEVWKYKGRVNQSVQNAMISSGLALKMDSEVKQLLARFRDRRDITFGSLTRAERAAEVGLIGNTATYTILLNACARDKGGLQRIRDVWREYQRYSQRHDSRALAALVRALVKSDSPDVARSLCQNRALGIPDEWATMDTRVTPEVLNPLLAKLCKEDGLAGALQALSYFSALHVLPDRRSLQSIVTLIGYRWKMPTRRQRDLLRYLTGILQPKQPSVAASRKPAQQDEQLPCPERTLGFITPDLGNIPPPVALYREVEQRNGSINAEHVLRIVEAYLERGTVDLAIIATLEAVRRGLPGLDGVSKLLVRRLAYEYELGRCKTVLWELRALGQPFALDEMVSIASHMEKQGYFHMAANLLSVCVPFTRDAADDVADSVRFRLLMRDRQTMRAIDQVAKRDRPLTDALRHDILRFSQWHKTHAADKGEGVADKLRALLDKPYAREAERCAEIKAKVGKALRLAMQSSVGV